MLAVYFHDMSQCLTTSASERQSHRPSTQWWWIVSKRQSPLQYRKRVSKATRFRSSDGKANSASPNISSPESTSIAPTIPGQKLTVLVVQAIVKGSPNNRHSVHPHSQRSVELVLMRDPRASVSDGVNVASYLFLIGRGHDNSVEVVSVARCQAKANIGDTVQLPRAEKTFSPCGSTMHRLGNRSRKLPAHDRIRP